MQHDGNDAAHCSSAMTARRFGAPGAEERVTYRKWIRGVVVLYGSLFLICTVIAVSYSGNNLARTAVARGPATSPARTN